MRQRKIIRTTLGELIVAVTDEVMPITRDSSGLYLVVSFILSDLLTYHQVRIPSGHDENTEVIWRKT
jgi:hypothetical protein